MDSRGGEARELLVHETAVSSFQWSPDGAFIAFRAADAESDGDKARKKNGRDVNVEDELGRPSHLWVLDVESGESHRVTEGDGFTVGPFDWNPDGSRLTFSATPSGRPMDSWKSDVYVVSAHDAEATPTKLTDNPGPDANPQWSPDGRYLYYSGQLTDRYQVAMNRLFRMSVDGGDIEDVSPHADIQASAFTLSSDGHGAFFSATTGTTRGLFYMSLEDRRPVRLTPDHGVYGSADLSDDGSLVVYTYEDPNGPVELYAAPLSRRPTAESVVAQRALTSHNTHTSDWTLGNTEVLRWKGVDGREVEGIVVYPHDWTPGAGPRATVVKIHGGPSGVYVENFQASSSTSDAQRYAADGYVVLLPNPRGSSGYGESGLQAVVGDWGGLDFQDIMAGVDTLIARGVSHPDSLGVMGWSYGGFMTAWTVTQTSRFKAAVAGAAITENIAMWGTQDIQHVFEAYFGGGPYEPGMWEVYQKSNPLAFIENATTPTLILHGRDDFLVPAWAAERSHELIEASRLEIADAGHFLPLAGPHGQLDWTLARLEPFLARHDLPGAPEPRARVVHAPPRRGLERLGLEPFTLTRALPWWVSLLVLSVAAARAPLAAAGVAGALVAGLQLDFGLGLIACLLGACLRRTVGTRCGLAPLRAPALRVLLGFFALLVGGSLAAAWMAPPAAQWLALAVALVALVPRFRSRRRAGAGPDG